MAFMQRRLAPLPKAFLSFDDEAPAPTGALRRSSSFPGFIPFQLAEVKLRACEPNAEPVYEASDAKEDPKALVFSGTDDDSEATAMIIQGVPELMTQQNLAEDYEASDAKEDPNAVVFPDTDDESETTTMIIQGVPELMTQHDLTEELNICGFQQLYDFCHLPWNFTLCRNEGYAIVNFVDPRVAQMFQKSWHHRMLTALVVGSQQVTIVRSHVQGLQENMKKWCGRRTQMPDIKPFAPPEVVKAFVAREQETGGRRMMPAVNLEPSVSRARRGRGHGRNRRRGAGMPLKA